LDTVGGVPETRHRFQEDLAELERQALGGIELVIGQLDRALETLMYQDAIERMGRLTRSLLSQANESFAERNVAAAQDLVRQDAEINLDPHGRISTTTAVHSAARVRGGAGSTQFLGRCGG
jgi:phosphate uptake regulator